MNTPTACKWTRWSARPRRHAPSCGCAQRKASSSFRLLAVGCTVLQGCCLSYSSRHSCQEHLLPEMVEVTDRLLHQASVHWCVSRFHQVEQASHSYYYLRCLCGVPLPSYAFRKEFQPNVPLLQCVEPSDVFEELTSVHLMLYLNSVLELAPAVSHAADMVDV